MDSIDVHILRALQENARKPLTEISKQVNLSIPAVSDRIRKMEQNGYIKQYTTILSSEKFEKDLMCLCFVTLVDNTQKVVQRFGNYVKHEPDILACHCITGEDEYLLKILTHSPSTLESILVGLRGAGAGKTSKSIIILSTIKDRLSIEAEEI